MKSFRLCVALTLACAVSALALPQSAQRTPRKGTSIRGRILTDDGQPLVKVQISVGAVRADRVGRVVGVDEGGNFEVEGLAPGLYRIFARVPGYVNLTDQTATYRPGDFVTLRFARGGVITGTVTGPAGEPVVAINVRAIRVRDENGRRIRESGFTFSRDTDDRGVYRVYGLPTGSYLLMAGARTFDLSSDYASRAPTYYPSSTPDTAAEITVGAGQEVTGADIRYRAERGHTISGTVTGGLPPDLSGGFSVSLTHIASGLSPYQAFNPTMERGRGFAFYGVADGEYELYVQSFGRGEDISSANRRVVVRGADITGLEIEIKPLGAISGRALLEPSETACKKDRVSLVEEIMLVARLDEKKAEGRFGSSFRGFAEGPATDKGEFTLRNLEAGRYSFTARLPDDSWYIREIASTAAGRTINIARNGIALKPGERVTDITVMIAEGAASVGGRIAQEKENADRMRAYLVPVEKENIDNPLRYGDTAIKSDGSFQFKNVAPGRYLLVARAVADEDWGSPPRIWDAEGRKKLRSEAEATNAVVELKPCQKIGDYIFRHTSKSEKQMEKK
jgi:hypothetical protein